MKRKDLRLVYIAMVICVIACVVTYAGKDEQKKCRLAPGAKAAESASRGGGDDVAGLARRVAELEERLAALEGRVGKAGASARRKPRKRKS